MAIPSSEAYFPRPTIVACKSFEGDGFQPLLSLSSVLVKNNEFVSSSVNSVATVVSSSAISVATTVSFCCVTLLTSSTFLVSSFSVSSFVHPTNIKDKPRTAVASKVFLNLLIVIYSFSM